MKVNVTHRVEIKDGERFKTLLVKSNPHEVSETTGKALIQEGKATPHAVAAPENGPEGDEVELSALTVTELRGMAKELGVVGYGDMNKAALIEAIDAANGEGD